VRIFQINGGVFGSTGKIMFGIARLAREQGHEVLCASPITSTNRNQQPEDEYIKIGSYYGRCLSVLLARLTGLEGCFSIFATHKLISRIKKYKPDVLHLHSIHNSYLNVPMLFRFIKKSKLRVIWTLHDCWAFTGHCPHFDMISCDKWQSECGRCLQYRDYPRSYYDNSRMMHRLKKKWFCGVDDLTIVTPSKWLADLVKRSFLKEYPVKIINNGIDLSVFKPTPGDFRKKNRLEDKIIVLGVAFGWGNRKGLDVFVELARRLNKRYQIVLVGTDEQVDKQLPSNIISIRRTQNQSELAEIYSAADVFVNPTREDTYPTVNMESIACGTPVITFDTGGSSETVLEKCGTWVEKDDVDALLDEIVNSKNKQQWSNVAYSDSLVQFDKSEKYSEYARLYSEV